MDQSQATATDGRIRRGDETRRAVLRRAVDVASVEGLDGVTIGRLALELSISKSGLFAHFGSKEELQLATIRAARAIFSQAVVTPALAQPAGMPRLRALLEGWLDYSRGREFPGGCFFSRATHEYAARPGAVRDALAEADPAIHYLDGLELYGAADHEQLPLPDNLHPDGETHRLIGRRFAEAVFGPDGAFAQPAVATEVSRASTAARARS